MALTGMNRFAALNNVNTDGQDGEVTFKSNLNVDDIVEGALKNLQLNNPDNLNMTQEIVKAVVAAMLPIVVQLSCGKNVTEGLRKELQV